MPGQEMYTGKISGDRPHEGVTLRVAYGKQWVIGGDVAVNSRGEFQVPSSARAVVAYIDSNHNGQFDRFAEPSGDCHLVAHEWSCAILLQRATLHRSITTRNDARNDQTLIFWEDFNANGTRIEDSQLCVEHRCTKLELVPFLTPSIVKSHELSICGEEGPWPQGAVIRRSGQRSTIGIPHPAKLDVSIISETPELRGGELRLSIKAPPCDRVLIWAGSVRAMTGEIEKVFWSSENADLRIVDAPQGIEARIPIPKVQMCRRDPDCEIVVQLVKYWSTLGTPVVSATEYRSTVNFRGSP